MRLINLILALMAVSVPSIVTAQTASPQTSQIFDYRLSGAAALRPSKIWDDGERTYILWARDVELPAVFTQGPDGREILAEGSMRGEQYVMDRVYSVLIFRIDRSIATARRRAKRHE